jgi:hypothetical protein
MENADDVAMVVDPSLTATVICWPFATGVLKSTQIVSFAVLLVLTVARSS